MIKSNNPHLAGGEKEYAATLADVVLVCDNKLDWMSCS